VLIDLTAARASTTAGGDLRPARFADPKPTSAARGADSASRSHDRAVAIDAIRSTEDSTTALAGGRAIPNAAANVREPAAVCAHVASSMPATEPRIDSCTSTTATMGAVDR